MSKFKVGDRVRTDNCWIKMFQGLEGVITEHYDDLGMPYPYTVVFLNGDSVPCEEDELELI
jgi:hypothetical protein